MFVEAELINMTSEEYCELLNDAIELTWHKILMKILAGSLYVFFGFLFGLI